MELLQRTFLWNIWLKTFCKQKTSSSRFQFWPKYWSKHHIKLSKKHTRFWFGMSPNLSSTFFISEINFEFFWFFTLELVVPYSRGDNFHYWLIVNTTYPPPFGIWVLSLESKLRTQTLDLGEKSGIHNQPPLPSLSRGYWCYCDILMLTKPSR